MDKILDQNRIDGTDEFLFAKINEETFKRKRTKTHPHAPESFEVDFDKSLTIIEDKGVEQQVKETAQILDKKTIRDEDEVFYNIYSKYEISQPNVKYLLERLGAKIVAYTDRKNNGFLLSASRERLQKLSEKPTMPITIITPKDIPIPIPTFFNFSILDYNSSMN